MLLGAIEENGGIFVIEELDEKGQTKNIVGQSLTIRQKGKDGAYDRLTFDNIEINNDTLKGLSDEEQAQILEIYKEAGKRAIEKDKKFLGKLLKKQKITQEQYDSLVLKEVVAGTGYNDLKGLKELSQAQIAVPDEAYYVYNGMGNLKRNAWIDSTGGHAPLGSNGTPVVIAVMDENELKQIQDRKLKTKKEVKPTEIPLWYGKVGKAQKLTRDQITEEKVEIIKQIEEITYREEQQLMNKNNVKTVDDIEYGYNIDNMNLEIGSNNDWYLIYGEYDDLLVISDLAVIGGINAEKNSTKNENIKSNPKLAIAESSNEVYDLLIHASEEDKRIVCNATANTSLVNITRMLKKGLASVKTLNGEKIEYREEGLVYSDSGKKVETRSWDDNGDIQMLDLEIIPNVPELEKEKKKVEEFLRRTQENIRMHGEEKEAGLDELRKQIREEKKASDAR